GRHRGPRRRARDGDPHRIGPIPEAFVLHAARHRRPRYDGRAPRRPPARDAASGNGSAAAGRSVVPEGSAQVSGTHNSIGSHPESGEESWRRIRAALHDREERAPDGGDLLGPIADAVEVLRRLARIEWERGVSAIQSYRRRTPAEVGEAVFLAALAIAGAV